MFKNNNLQKKMFVRVWIVVSLIILGLTSGTVLFEKNRCLNKEFSRIYHATFAIKKNLADLFQGVDSRYLKISLANAMCADSEILYFVLTDTNGRILISDNEQRVGKKGFEMATIQALTHPLFETVHVEQNKSIPSRFVIYASRLNEDIIRGTNVKAGKNEIIFDAFWDITRKGTSLGTFRMGFSRQGIQRYLLLIGFGMLGTGFLALLCALGCCFIIVKRNCRSLGRFSSQLTVMSDMSLKDLSNANLSVIDFETKPSDPEEILNLKQAVMAFKKRMFHHWATLEEESQAFEIRLGKKQNELDQANNLLLHQEKERKEIEIRLLNSQKLEAVGTLAGGIAHEFNNLFMAITGYASLIQKQSSPDHPNSAKAKKILGLVDNGSQSVKQLLGFARIGKYTPGHLNINEVIRLTMAIFKKTRKDLEIHTKYTKGIWNIYADRSQMEHVVMNLLLNASEAMPGIGQLSIETGNILLEKKQLGMDKVVSGRFVHFSIQDQGKGIEPKHLRRLFDPFFTTKPLGSGTGTGLGLASVYGIINNHDGFTTVESTVGEGTVFNVFLPAAKEEPQEKKQNRK